MLYVFICKVRLIGRQSSCISTEPVTIETNGLRGKKWREHAGDSCVEFR